MMREVLMRNAKWVCNACLAYTALRWSFIAGLAIGEGLTP